MGAPPHHSLLKEQTRMLGVHLSKRDDLRDLLAQARRPDQLCRAEASVPVAAVKNLRVNISVGAFEDALALLRDTRRS